MAETEPSGEEDLVGLSGLEPAELNNGDAMSGVEVYGRCVRTTLQ